MKYEEIDIMDIENIQIGNAQDEENGTGLTVIICKKGAPTGLAVLGGGPASREPLATDPVVAAEEIHSVVLGGGSAFGLDAAGGVMEFLEEKGIGYDVGITKVPIVVQANLFDLTCGGYKVRPDKKMAIEACKDSEKPLPRKTRGNIGVGIGATVGKAKGADFAMKAGIGSFAVKVGELKIGAIVAVNCFGDIYDIDTGKKLAGILDDSKKRIGDSEQALCDIFGGQKANLFTDNTTIGCLITNGKFDKVKMKKIAYMAFNGYARTIRPVNTTADGDSIYAMSVGDVNANIDMVGTLASEVMGKAINQAVINAKAAYGFPGYDDIEHE